MSLEATVVRDQVVMVFVDEQTSERTVAIVDANILLALAVELPVMAREGR